MPPEDLKEETYFTEKLLQLGQVDSVSQEYQPSKPNLLLIQIQFVLSYSSGLSLKEPAQNQDGCIWMLIQGNMEVDVIYVMVIPNSTAPDYLVQCPSHFVLKSMGKRTEPCGTSQDKFHPVESAPLMKTLCVQSDRKELNHKRLCEEKCCYVAL